MAFRFGPGAIGADDGDLPLNGEINVTPFIDVMLVLLIIFMVAAPLATVDIKVDLPVAEAPASAPSEQPILVTLRADGALSVNDNQVDLAQLGSAVDRAAGQDREQRIFLQADRAVPYEALMQAMSALRRAGYLRVALTGAEGGRG